MSQNYAELLKRIAKQDEAALEILLARFGGPVYSLVQYVLRDNALAQEATQDTFLKVWRNPQAWDPAKGPFGSWLLTMARYTAIDRLRREIRVSGRDTELHDELRSDPDGELDQIEKDELRALLANLPPEQRLLIQLAYFRGMKHRELSAALDLPLGTVKTRLRLGLQKLREMLSDKS